MPTHLENLNKYIKKQKESGKIDRQMIENFLRQIPESPSKYKTLQEIDNLGIHTEQRFVSPEIQRMQKKFTESTLGKTPEDKARILEILGGAELSKNPHWKNLYKLAKGMERGEDISRVINELSTEQKGHAIALLYIAGGYDTLSSNFSQNTAFELFELLSGSTEEEAIKILTVENRIIGEINEELKKDGSKNVLNSKSLRLASAIYIDKKSNLDLDKIFELSNSVNTINFIASENTDEFNLMLHKMCFENKFLPKNISLSDLKELASNLSTEQNQKLLSMVENPRDQEALKEFIDLQNIKEGKVTEKTIESFLEKIGNSVYRLYPLLPYLENLPQKFRDQILHKIENRNYLDRAIQYLIENKLNIPLEIKKKINNLRINNQGGLLIKAIENGQYRELRNYFDLKNPDIVLYFNQIIKACKKRNIPIPKELIELAMKGDISNVISKIIAEGQEFLQSMPKEFLDYIPEKFNTEQSEDIIYGLLTKDLLNDISNDILERLQFDGKIALRLLEYHAERKYPEVIKNKIKKIKLDSREKYNLIVRSLFIGDLSLLKELGGQEFFDECLDLDKLHMTDANSLLDHLIEIGWETSPKELKKRIAEYKWQFFPHQITKIADFELIAKIAENSNFNLEDLKYVENSESFRGLFVGSNIEDINRIIDSENFKKNYPEYYSLSNKYIALGEKGLIVRAAYKGIKIEKLLKLLEISTNLGAKQFETTSLISALHKNNIYWESKAINGEKALLYNPELKQYRIGDNEKLSKNDLIDFIISRANPNDPESIYWLLRPEFNKEGEDITKDDYLRIFLGFLHRNNLDINILRDLAQKGGIIEPKHFEKLLVDIISDFPSPSQIEYLTTLGNISKSRYKDISLSYYKSKKRLEGKTFKIFFDYLRNDPENKYTHEEKRKFWKILFSKYEENLFLEDLQIFENEGVLNDNDFRIFTELYLEKQGTPTESMVKYLFKKIKDPSSAEHFIRLYIEKNSLSGTWILKIFNEYVEKNNWWTEGIIEAFSLFMYKGNLNTRELFNFLDTFGSKLNKSEIKTKFIELTSKKNRIDSHITPEELNKLEIYNLDRDNYAELFENAIRTQKFRADTIDQLIDKYGYTEEQISTRLNQIIKQQDIHYTNRFIVEVFAKRLPPHTLFDILFNVLTSGNKLHEEHIHALNITLLFKDKELNIRLWRKVRQTSPEFNFLSPEHPDIFRFISLNEERKKKGYYFEGTQAKNLETESQEDSRTFYKRHIIYSENGGWIPQKSIDKIFQSHPEILSRLRKLKRQTAQEVANSRQRYLDVEHIINQKHFLTHGTFQNEVIKRKNISQDEQLGARTTVQAICESSGVRIAWEKATGGAFTEFSIANNRYGSVGTGSMVMIPAEWLLESHSSISGDPGGADGKVARDISSDRLNEIPARVCLNPQAGIIEGIQLNDSQMAEYIIRLEHKLNKEKDLIDQIEEIALQYESLGLGVRFVEEIKIIHESLRSHGYTEGAILWPRDYFTRMALSQDPNDQLQYKALRKIVNSIELGYIKDDFRSILDNIRSTWDRGLKEKITSLKSGKTLVEEAKKIMKKNQRSILIESLRTMRPNPNESDIREKYIGVARQLMLQYEKMKEIGGIREWSDSENLASSRAIFMDTETDEQYKTAIQQTEKFARHLTAIKDAVLRTTFNRSIDNLSEENKSIYRKYAERMAVCSSGSQGRGEAIISSDLDYLIFLNDTNLTDAEIIEIREMLVSVGQNINNILINDYNIRPDAGLANRDRQPIVTLSKINYLRVDIGASRQEVEPSEILDAQNVHSDEISNNLSNLFKTAFLERNVQILNEQEATLAQYFQSKNEGFLYNYNTGLSQFLTGDQLKDFKLQLQRIFNFKIYGLIAENFERIAQEGFTIPSNTIEKIDLLRAIEVLNPNEASNLKELSLMLYRLRYRADVLTSASLAQAQERRGDTRAKINAEIEPRNISATERSKMLELFRTFNQLAAPNLISTPA